MTFTGDTENLHDVGPEEITITLDMGHERRQRRSI